MAHVEKTEVHIYGKMFKYRNGLGLIERTLIFGRVYGGGDLANVGSKKPTLRCSPATTIYPRQTAPLS